MKRKLLIAGALFVLFVMIFAILYTEYRYTNQEKDWDTFDIDRFGN